MLDDILRERSKKLENISASGQNPYPARVKRTHGIAECLSHFWLLSLFRRPVAIAGRVTALRKQGGLIFADVRDRGGSIQVLLKKDELNNFSFFEDNLDIGDFLEAGGILIKTRRGEKSVKAREARIIVKSLQPLPSSWYGIKDVEERFRKRYLDMLLNKEVDEKLRERSEIIKALRDFLAGEGFMEVETPVFQPIPGGAKARPFVTHHNALDEDFYLRIAPELYLKRLLVAGWEKIYELGKVFRNEGIDRDHNPEFTMLELYWAYQDYNGLMDFTEKMLKSFKLEALSFEDKLPRITYAEAFKKYAKKDSSKLNNDELDEVFKKEVRPKIKEPTFVIDHPKVISPLAKSKEDNHELAERFQLIVNGMEIVNGFSELNDPIDQRKRMEEQEKRFRAGDEEESRFDAEFIEALGYGMPPAAGLGIGIDRLVAIATGTHAIKEIIIFPTLHAKKK
ncbi:lysine--tRNA ligase [Candidatus Wolfebacteria bacterium RIFCSPLOWO2_01_FULL_45_19]|uniref:Lysine--tRNA ligase n=1 Tax=Candidatus Wolfebacteria bacterium RIFCSPLOWO2_01_FULL_45_19 TaxID=1802557 RepID=A0A1F8DUM8_9BACT|nr:MAG: lysine--tRNA ligase [Candidatus Wolfebacteria bacterium RIFCSPLOWO2_01_FULL_45_19]